MERIQKILSVVLPLWTGILLIYTFEMNPLIGFLTKDAAKKLQTMLKTEKLTEKFGHQTIQINISTILPLEAGILTKSVGQRKLLGGRIGNS